METYLILALIFLCCWFFIRNIKTRDKVNNLQKEVLKQHEKIIDEFIDRAPIDDIIKLVESKRGRRIDKKE